MARIEGVDLPRDKRVVIGLTYIYGIGQSTSKKLLDSADINQDTRVRDLSESEVQRLRELISGLTIEGDLRRQTQLNIKRLMEINSYRGLRHRRRPAGARGQRTRTNGRTRRGKKQTVAGRGRRARRNQEVVGFPVLPVTSGKQNRIAFGYLRGAEMRFAKPCDRNVSVDQLEQLNG